MKDRRPHHQVCCMVCKRLFDGLLHRRPIFIDHALVFDRALWTLLKTKQQRHPTKEQKTNHSCSCHSTPTIRI